MQDSIPAPAAQLGLNSGQNDGSMHGSIHPSAACCRTEPPNLDLTRVVVQLALPLHHIPKLYSSPGPVKSRSSCVACPEIPKLPLWIHCGIRVPNVTYKSLLFLKQTMFPCFINRNPNRNPNGSIIGISIGTQTINNLYTITYIHGQYASN